MEQNGDLRSYHMAEPTTISEPPHSSSSLDKDAGYHRALGTNKTIGIISKDACHRNGYPATYNNGAPETMPEKELSNPMLFKQNLVAICGMAMRLPGGISSDVDFWRLLMSKRDARIKVPTDRYNIDAFHNKAAKSYVIQPQHGYFLDHIDLTRFDESFFSMTRSEVEQLDPQHRLLLELTREALEGAGEINWQGKDIGCYVGSFGEDWVEMQTRDTQQSTKSRVTGYGDYALANRISWCYDFKGPSVTVKSACSSSLTGLDMACKAIKVGEITSAVVAGSNLIMNPRMTQALDNQGVLSASGSCRTFDAAADGYARGEAVNVLYLKRLDDAVRDGNPIRAIIRATATNFDGKTPNIAQPSATSQEALIRKCYDLAGIENFGDTAFVECHGTGTPIGDPLETTAIANVFGNKGVYIGSVKPNLGHSEGAAGLTSIIKTVLALEHKTIPPNIKFVNPNPNVPFDKGRLIVPVEPLPWPTLRCERASVNCFGIGGSNAHIILESASSQHTRKETSLVTTSSTNSTPRLLVVTGNEHRAVKKGTELLAHYTDSYPQSLENLSYTLGARREHLVYRSFAVTDGAKPPAFSPTSKVPSALPMLVYVFTGQGAQWPMMAADLLSSFPSASKDIDFMDEALSKLDEAPKWTLRDELLKPKTTSRVDESEFSQPLSTAVQIVIVNLLRSWGVVTAAVIGHSSGEVAAAYACGALTMQQAIIVAYLRGLAFTQTTPSPGAMAAVGIGRKHACTYIHPDDGVVIACENSPASVTLSGERDGIDTVIQRIKSSSPEIFTRKLRVQYAYHSPHMREAGAQFERLLGTFFPSKAPSLPFFSTQTGTLIRESGALNSTYWKTSYDHPVLFHTALITLLANEAFSKSPPILLEIGPHCTLAGPIRQILYEAASEAVYIPTLVRDESSSQCMVTAAGQLFLNGMKPDFCAMNPNGRVLTDLPHYDWNHETSYWNESRLSKEYRQRQFPHHDLLGSRVPECGNIEPCWRNVLSLSDVPWLRDHVISGDIIFPGAGYIAMAGEAIRQINQVQGLECKGFTLRDLTLTTALVLHDFSSVEMVFSLRPSRLTASLDSEWYDFTISSLNDKDSWTKHCVGRVRAGGDRESVIKSIQDQARKIRDADCYRLLKNAGMSYGPRFQGLNRVSAHPVEHRAVAYVQSDTDESDSVYHLHPALIDSLVQLFTFAACSGQTRAFTSSPLVPTRLGEIYVRKLEKTASSQVAAEAVAEPMLNRGLVGTCLATVGNEVVVRMRDVMLSPLGDGDHSLDGDNPHGGVCLQWRPDIDLVDISSLASDSTAVTEPKTIHDLEMLTSLCYAEAIQILQHLCEPNGSTQNAPDSTRQQILQLQTKLGHIEAEGSPLFCSQIKEDMGLPSLDRMRLIQYYTNQLSETSAALMAQALSCIIVSLEAIIIDKSDPLETLSKESPGILPGLHRIISTTWLNSLGPYLDLLSHKMPHQKILEVGAHDIHSVELILKRLVSLGGDRMYHSYTFATNCHDTLSIARDKFMHVPFVDIIRLDENLDITQQLEENNTFDLIILSDMRASQRDASAIIPSLHRLLSHRGKFILKQSHRLSPWFSFISQIAPSSLPLCAHPLHNENLNDCYSTAASFDTTRTIWSQSSLAITSTSVISASEYQRLPAVRSIFLLSEQQNGPVATRISAVLRRRGFDVSMKSLSEVHAERGDVMSILDLETACSFLSDIGTKQYSLLKEWIIKLQESSNGVIWLTKPCQMSSQEPDYAQILGLARTMRSELAVDFATVELDDFDKPDSLEAIVKCFELFLARKLDRRGTDELEPDFEYVLHQGAVYIPRFHWISVTERTRRLSKEETDGIKVTKRLEIGKRGLLKSLQWVPQQPQPNLTDNQVSIKVHSVGMNFKDVLMAMGVVYGREKDGDGLGCECAGVVMEIGPDVEDLNVGDRVCVATTNSWATELVTSADNCARLPEPLSFEDAATMPCVYGTVLYGLIDLAKLQAGQSVLIHSACGGIGIAALNVAFMVGADVFATVGSQEKVDYLVKTFDIPRSRIFSSRDTQFLKYIMDETGGRGVDVVLNSLSGELLHATWRCVAKFGSMVEIGKRDILGYGHLSMREFEANRSFFGVDFAQMFSDQPKKLKSILRRVVNLYQEGKIQPIRPIHCFNAIDLEEAFRILQTGQHIGKLVVRMPKDSSELPGATVNPHLSFRSDASYLIIGGLGGLGRAVATWMVEHGARNLVFLSRSGGACDPHADVLKSELIAMGCVAQVVAGSVARLDDIRRAITEARYPIAGVLQMAMVLRDSPFEQMSHEDWRAATEPKVAGAWNLHVALDQQPLDFFVLFSSYSGIVGNPGQANYAAANTFLDAFVNFRRAQGLPASVLDIGVMGGIGYASQNQAVIDHFKAKGAYFLNEQQLLDGIEYAIKISKPHKMARTKTSFPFDMYANEAQLGIGFRMNLPITSPNNQSTWKLDPRMALYRNLDVNDTRNNNTQSTGSTAGDEVKTFLLAAERDPSMLQLASSAEQVAKVVGITVLGFMMKPAEEFDVLSSPLSIGMDSLVATELRNWCRQRFAVDISILEIMGSASFLNIGIHVIGVLFSKLNMGT